MAKLFSRLAIDLLRTWRGTAGTPRHKRGSGVFSSAAAEVVEVLEPRQLLTAVPGPEVAVNYNYPVGMTGPQTENPSVAMSADGSKVVMVVADNTYSNSHGGTVIPQDTVRVLEYTNNGTNLTLVRNYVLESDPNLIVGANGNGPLVAMKGDGSQYVVTWHGVDGSIRAASVLFNGATVVAPTDIVAPTNTNGTLTYTINASPHSIAMRGDGTFVEAWDSTMVDSNNPGVSLREAQARVFNINLTTSSPMIQQLNTTAGQEAWAPVVAWTNHGTNATWDVVWTLTDQPWISGGMPPTQHPGSEIMLQKYTFTGTGNTFANQTVIIPPGSSGTSGMYTQVSLTDDPTGNVGFVDDLTNQPAQAAIWIFTPSLTPYPGLASPITTYNPVDSQMQALATIAFDAPGGGAFQHVLVGTQRYMEGPGANWGYMDASGNWLYTGTINQFPPMSYTENMFPAAAMNSQGNWWVFATQYFINSVPVTGWMIRAWDPPVGASAGASHSGLAFAGSSGNNGAGQTGVAFNVSPDLGSGDDFSSIFYSADGSAKKRGRSLSSATR